MSPAPFFTSPQSEQDTAPGSIGSHATCPAAVGKRVTTASEFSYAEQCAALALYHQTVERYLADVEAVEGDPAFFDAIGRLHAGRANGAN
jgi:hypothetical protein